jgi:cystathionine gamma-synthase
MPPPTRHPSRACRTAARMTAASPAAASTAAGDPTSSPAHAQEATVRAYLPVGAMDEAACANAKAVVRAVYSDRGATVMSAGGMTRAVHGGERVRGGKKAKATYDAICTPIVQSSTFTFESTRDCIDYNTGDYDSFEYGRYGSPTVRAAEEKLMALEGAEDALISASGMNSVTTMLLTLVPQGGHIVTTTDCYRRTRQFVNTLLPKMGIRTTVIDPADLASLESIFETQGASLFFSESPTNPLIRVVDTPAITRLCSRYGVISCIDTTFATPANYRPILDGADLVLHSGTKYLAGHHDVLCGALAGRADLIATVRALHGVLGGVIDPHAAYLLNRGMKTLGLRMEAHNRNASNIATYLESHPKISKVHYPTLLSHIDYEVASRVFANGFGGVLSFELKGDGNAWSRNTFEATGRFVDALRIPYIGPSLGGCESLIEQVCIMGYFDQPLRERQRLGINNGLIRFAAGIEDHTDLINDIEQALGFA